MTDAARIAQLEEENAQLRKALADLAESHRAHAERERVERERKEARRRVNRQNYERRKGVKPVQTSDSDRIQTLNHPSPPLDGSPLSPEPSLPSPLSSPQPPFSGVGQSETVAAAEEKTTFRLLPAEPDRPAEKPKRAEKPKANPEALREVWNRVAVPLGFQRWEGMGDDRKRDARLALDACPDLVKWESWLSHELVRPWNRGENPDGWKANVDWLLRKKTRNLVLDFNPSAVSATRTPSGGDVPRLGPRPVAVAAAPNPDKPRL